MNVTYTGKHSEIPPAKRQKLEAKLLTISKMIEQNGEREAHVFLAQERFLHKAEIKLNAWDRTLIGSGSDADVFKAIKTAIAKLEKQVVDLRARWRANKRHKEAPRRTPEAAIALQEKLAPVPDGKAAKKTAPKKAAASAAATVKIFRVNHHEKRKPMTVDEAMMDMEPGGEYVVYRDAGTARVSVLVRRKDGNFDLIES